MSAGADIGNGGVATGGIRLVTFDLDNTLWSVDGVIRRAESEMRAWLKPRVPEFGSLHASTLGEIRRSVMAADPDIVHDLSRLRVRILWDAIEHCGYGAETARELAQGAFDTFLDWRHRVTYFDDALETLAALHGRYTLAALTNGNADFERLGLGHLFSFGYSAADVGASKPHPEMFQRALAHADVEPTEAVHIGDHPVDDIEGARSVGMYTIWANLTDQTEPAAASATITRLKDIPDAVAGLG